jgi:hypothetical protein
MVPIILAASAALGALMVLGSKASAASTRTLAEGPPSDPPQPLPPTGYRRAKASDLITAAMRDGAVKALSQKIGTLIEREGWAIQLEWHFHEPDGPIKPWGWHKGATVYLRA